ncbi:TRAP transporter small permease [Falsiroseomonas sp.]|uniref:TRAP transporter small permease n=1 Tax=Falsiroseomonas sp. TaxID=2870721 RepID=UPI00356B0C83
MSEGTAYERQGFLRSFLYYFSALALIGSTCLIFYATIARYFFNAPPFWGEEVAVILFIWMGFTAAGLAISNGWNVRVQAIDLVLKERTGLVLRAVLHVMAVGFLGTLLWHSAPVVELSLFGTLEATRLPSVVITAALPVGLALMMVFQSVLLVQTIVALRTGKAG